MARRISLIIADQRIRFLIVGGINTVVGYTLFAVFTQWLFSDVFLGYLISLGLSYALAISLAFVLYRRLVFVVRGHVVRDLVRFISVYIVAIGANALALPLLVEIAGLPPLLAQAIILVVTTLLSFLGHKNFSFRRDPRDEDSAGPVN